MITGTKMTNTGPFWWNGSSKIQIFTDFSTFSVGGRGGQLMLFFWKLIRETQISKPPEATRHHNSTKLLILVPLRADLLCTLHYETPCRLRDFLYYVFRLQGKTKMKNNKKETNYYVIIWFCCQPK